MSEREWIVETLYTADHRKLSEMVQRLESNPDFRGPAALRMLDVIRRHRDLLAF